MAGGYNTFNITIQAPRRWLLDSSIDQFKELCITGLTIRARDIFNHMSSRSDPVFLCFNDVRGKVHWCANGYWIRHHGLNFDEIIDNENYAGFILQFDIPHEWLSNCIDLAALLDFCILAAGVRRYNLFNDSPLMGDQYFLEHQGIVVEIKEVEDFKILLLKRPDIPTLFSLQFDFDIINCPEEESHKKWG
ncbi:uncharacterized protein LOC127287894 [Leptopilina boulardi]|uniref:uncharacterized protein LOC127287894 n=1 Tax=Leptopilina boulardi TaxID=63433 RepID=UPI0021F6767A|nr:uncharacterized protein LOC127287894 [Leptopilina boulardi]XP_051171008.1 uncharacterized protein LOC127287894 [Leptopilina boulardi]